MNELNSAPLKPQLRMYVPMSGSYYGEEPISVTICLGKKRNQSARKLPDWRSKGETSEDDCSFEIT
jgi:hypothetical protein